MNSFLLPIHKLLITHKKLLELLLVAVEVSVFLFIFVIAWLVSSNMLTIGEMIEIGHFLGTGAFFFFSLSLIPGVITRLELKQLSLVGTMLMLFRRHFGILMFMFTLTHFFLVSIFLTVLGGFEVLPDPIRVSGMIAFFIAIPLWFTSNDYAERFLGKWWKRLHRLTYLILIAVFAHFIFLGEGSAVLAGIALFFEAISWIKAWYKKLRV